MTWMKGSGFCYEGGGRPFWFFNHRLGMRSLFGGFFCRILFVGSCYEDIVGRCGCQKLKLQEPAYAEARA